MLQALGVIGRDFDSQTRERRRTTFWHLNLLDKGLAIIFGRTPTFHRQMVREIGLPRLEEIQPFKRHLTLNGSPSFFGVHYMYQKILLSHLMDDIWDCLYGDTKANESSIERSNKGLELWYEEAKRVGRNATQYLIFANRTNCGRLSRPQRCQKNHFAISKTQSQ